MISEISGFARTGWDFLSFVGVTGRVILFLGPKLYLGAEF